MRVYLGVVVIVAIFIVTFGVIAPALVSMDDDVAVICGLLVFAAFPVQIFWVGRFFFRPALTAIQSPSEKIDA